MHLECTEDHLVFLSRGWLLLERSVYLVCLEPLERSVYMEGTYGGALDELDLFLYVLGVHG